MSTKDDMDKQPLVQEDPPIDPPPNYRPSAPPAALPIYGVQHDANVVTRPPRPAATINCAKIHGDETYLASAIVLSVVCGILFPPVLLLTIPAMIFAFIAMKAKSAGNQTNMERSILFAFSFNAGALVLGIVAVFMYVIILSVLISVKVIKF